MVDTALSSLAENLDGPEWPGKNKIDSPADYIDLDYEDAVALLDSHGYPAGTIEVLITILEETLAFDDPFGEMVEHSDAAAEASNPILENLEKLKIPGEFPIKFSSLSSGTKEFCELENLETVEAFAVFAQGMSQNVIVGGDFRELLNALSHVDEKMVAKYLPFRPGQPGLHLIEAVGALVRELSDIQREALAKRGASAPPGLAGKVGELLGYFSEELASIKSRVESGTPLSREVMVLQDPPIEPLVAKLLEPEVGAAIPEKKSGWFARLFGR
jgi:hypothetical protein